MAESDSNDPWGEVADVSLDGRSIVPYPDPHPEFTAAVWDRWRAERAARLATVVPDENAGDDVYKNNEPPVITLEAEEFDEPCSALAGYVKLAHSSGWTIAELAHSKATARGKIIQSGERAGQSNPDWDIETQWLKIEKPGVGRAVVSYTLVNDKTYNVYRSFNGLAGRADKDMKELIKG